MPDITRYLSIRAAGGGRSTADGSTVCFVSNITGVPQAWSVPAAGGWPTQLTFADNRVGSVAPSPVDSSTVVFSRDDGGNERMQIHRVSPDGFGEIPLVEDPKVIHRFGDFGPDGSWFVFCDNRRNGVDFDVYWRSMTGDEMLIAELSGWNVVTHVSPSGKHALVAHFESNVDSDLFLIDLDTGEIELITPHEGPVLHAPAGFGTAKRTVFLTSDREGEFSRAYRWRDGDFTVFGPEGHDIDALEIERGLGLIGWNDGGRTRLAWLDPETLEVGGEIELPLGVAGGVDVAPDGRSALFTFSGAASNADVWRLTAGEREPHRVTMSSTAGLDASSFVEPELIHIESFDGLDVPAWVYRPSGVEKPPVVVSVHGGPEAQERPSFNGVYQYLVANGWAVMAPNVRGSSGYGRTYLSLDDVRKRMDSVEDLNALGEWIKASEEFDDNRVAVMGGSYGGFMVLAALATRPDLWTCGVDIVGIANFVTFLQNTGDYRRALRESEYGSLADDREFLESISPTTLVDQITSPLLVIHGANDPRVPLGEAEQIVQHLRDRDREVELLVFDDEGHGIVKLANRKVAYGRIAEFLAAHLG